MKKEREALENPPITAPQSDVCVEGEGITAPVTVVSRELIDMMRMVSKPSDGDEHDGSVGMTNALLHDFSRDPEPQETVGEGGYLTDGMGHFKRG